MGKKIITVGNVKGGVGKTRIATGLATMFSYGKYKVLLVDADIQDSSINYRKRRSDLADDIKKNPEIKKEWNLKYDTIPEFQTVKLRSTTIEKDLEGFDHDIIVIDTGGRDDREFRSCVFASDYFIMPVKPSLDDLESTKEAIDIWNKITAVGKDIKAGIVQNMVLPNKRIKFNQSFEDLIKETTKENGLKEFRGKLYQRLAYFESASFGLNVNEIKEKNYETANKEFTNFYKEVKKWLEI